MGSVHVTIGLCADSVGHTVAWILRSIFKGPVAGYKLPDIFHINDFSL